MGKGAWAAYPPIDTARLEAAWDEGVGHEAALAARHGSREVDVSFGLYSVNLRTMLQRNCVSGWTRAVRRRVNKAACEGDAYPSLGLASPPFRAPPAALPASDTRAEAVGLESAAIVGPLTLKMDAARVLRRPRAWVATGKVLSPAAEPQVKDLAEAPTSGSVQLPQSAVGSAVPSPAVSSVQLVTPAVVAPPSSLGKPDNDSEHSVIPGLVSALASVRTESGPTASSRNVLAAQGSGEEPEYPGPPNAVSIAPPEELRRPPPAGAAVGPPLEELVYGRTHWTKASEPIVPGKTVQRRFPASEDEVLAVRKVFGRSVPPKVAAAAEVERVENEWQLEAFMLKRRCASHLNPLAAVTFPWLIPAVDGQPLKSLIGSQILHAKDSSHYKFLSERCQTHEDRLLIRALSGAGWSRSVRADLEEEGVSWVEEQHVVWAYHGCCCCCCCWSDG